MHLDGRYLPLGFVLPLHDLQVRQSIADRLTILLAQNHITLISFRSRDSASPFSGACKTGAKTMLRNCRSYFGTVVHGQVVRGSVVNHDVLLLRVVPTISQPSVRLVPRIRVEIVHLVIDPGRHGIVKRLVVDVILVIATRVEVILPTRCRPVILVLVLVLVRALINTNYGRVIRVSRPFRRLENGQIRC